jgi:hypothetical protein
LVVVVVGALLGALVAIVVVPAAEGDDETTVVLEAAVAPGTDPFTSSVVTGDAAATVEAVDANVHANAPVSASRSVGNAPGLYGGTGDTAACDAAQLARFLSDNPAKARAWASVLGIGPDRIGAYLDGLNPVVLTRDTRVTNHGFTNGRATSFQAVLQAGTAVLVDANGVPRVKCSCGNPLTAPSGAAVGTVSGTPWPGYSTATVIVVVPAPRPMTTFVLVDIDTGETYEERANTPDGAPTGGSGDEGGAIRGIDFLNRTYPATLPCAPLDEDVTVTNGRWERDHGGPAGIESVQVVVTYLDATGDGDEDAVVALTYNGGGNVFGTHYCVYAMDGGDAVLAGAFPEIGQSRSVPTLDGGRAGRVVLWVPQLMAGDPRCCPSQYLRKVYAYRDGTFVEIGQTTHVPEEVPSTTVPERTR